MGKIFMDQLWTLNYVEVVVSNYISFRKLFGVEQWNEIFVNLCSSHIKGDKKLVSVQVMNVLLVQVVLVVAGTI